MIVSDRIAGIYNKYWAKRAVILATYEAFDWI